MGVNYNVNAFVSSRELLQPFLSPSFPFFSTCRNSVKSLLEGNSRWKMVSLFVFSVEASHSTI